MTRQQSPEDRASRFWAYHPLTGGLIRLTLRGGERITIPTPYGSVSWEHHGGEIRRETEASCRAYGFSAVSCRADTCHPGQVRVVKDSRSGVLMPRWRRLADLDEDTVIDRRAG